MRYPRSIALLLALPALATSPTRAETAIATSPTGVLRELTYNGAMRLDQLARAEGASRSLAPYLYVAGGDPQKDRVPLKQTWAEVNIAGVIAAVKVHQVFENNGARAIEAVYVFPASTQAAVHAMRMKIGARTIEAKIARKAEARARYAAAKQAGQRASLLEQARPNVFTTSVANLMPGDRIEVELDYSEMIIPHDGTYEFVYPTVVGPRYTGGADARTDQWMANPHLPAGQAEPYAWDLKVHLQTGIGLKEVSSPSHRIAVNYAGTSTADIRLDQRGGGNKDFILRYRLAGEKIESGLLLFAEPAAGGGRPTEKFFALLMEPPRRPTLAELPAREFIFLLDVSGSMHGFPLDTTKALMRRLLPTLRPHEHFNVVFFSGANYVWSPTGSRPATPKNIEAALRAIGRETGGGGTELMGGLEAAYRIPAAGRGIARSVVVVTDGFVGVEAKAFRFIRERLGEANLFAFGIGNSVNRGLIEGMARAGLGEPFVVLGPDKAAEQADKLRTMIDRPVLTDIRLKLDGAGAYEIAPAAIPDLLAERPLLIYGKYKAERPTRIEITGRTGRGAFHHAVDLRPADARPANQALRALWARKWVEILEDEMHLGAGSAAEAAITDLGLFYNLLTPFTSFVAVDSEVVNPAGQSDTVRQPLPMPEGVSNQAMGYGAGAGQPTLVHRAKRPQPMAPPPPVMAPLPTTMAAPSPRMAKEKLEDELSLAGAPLAEASAAPRASRQADKKERARSCHPVVAVETNQGAAPLDGLLQLLTRLAADEPCGPGQLKLRLTVDTKGHILQVDRVAGDAALATRLAGKLKGKTSSTKAASGRATVVLTVSLR